MANIEATIRCKTNMVVGTTGWYAELPNVRNQVERARTGFIWASNFSIGVNLFFAIVREGALEEVGALMARALSPALPVMKAVGVRELAAHLTGQTSLKDALALAQQQTRRYAKRQSTWLRNQTPDLPRLRTDREVEDFLAAVSSRAASS